MTIRPDGVKTVAAGARGGGGMDVYHFRAQSACGFEVVGLDRDADRELGPGSCAWREWLGCDNRVGPGDEAAFGLDFAVGLDGLPGRRRRSGGGSASTPSI